MEDFYDYEDYRDDLEELGLPESCNTYHAEMEHDFHDDYDYDREMEVDDDVHDCEVDY